MRKCCEKQNLTRGKNLFYLVAKRYFYLAEMMIGKKVNRLVTLGDNMSNFFGLFCLFLYYFKYSHAYLYFLATFNLKIFKIYINIVILTK